MATIKNLTPHTISLRDAEGVDHQFTSVGIARVTSTPGGRETVEGIPVPVFGRETFGEVVNLPPPEDGVLFLVSALVASALAGSRTDVVVPGTGPADNPIREDGKIVAVTCLKRA